MRRVSFFEENQKYLALPSERWDFVNNYRSDEALLSYVRGEGENLTAVDVA